MTTEQMIKELYKVAGQHKNDVVGVGELNIHAMCTDVASRLKELYEQTKLATDTNVGNKWIQCSERLPSENGKYFATGIKGSVYIAEFYKGVINGKPVSLWCRSGGHYCNVIAWMELPPAYKGEV